MLYNLISHQAPPQLLLRTEAGKETEARNGSVIVASGLTRQVWSRLPRPFSLGSHPYGQPSLKWPEWSNSSLLFQKAS